MIIMLYETNYPMSEGSEPYWKNLPIGFFVCKKNGLKELSLPLMTYGDFIFAEKEIMFRPSTGDHYFAVFNYQNDSFIYRSTITILDTRFIGSNKIKCRARLGLSKLIKRWNWKNSLPNMSLRQ